MSNIFNGLFDDLLTQVGKQTTNIQRLDEKLKEFAPGSGVEVPIATRDRLGVIKVGNNLEITPDGTLSSTGGGGHGTVYSDEVILRSASYQHAQDAKVQDSLNEIYSLIGDINSVLLGII